MRVTLGTDQRGDLYWEARVTVQNAIARVEALMFAVDPDDPQQIAVVDALRNAEAQLAAVKRTLDLSENIEAFDLRFYG